MQNSCHEPVITAFTATPTYVDTNRGEGYYKALFEKCKQRLDSLKAESTSNSDSNIYEILEANDITRRDFLKWVSATTATLMLPSFFEPLVAEAAEMMNRAPVIWIELQDCAGNSEALLRSSAPTVDDLLFDY
jgi:quinone-reactive Ni/Fe-hydrogenase small subunit